MSELDHGKTVCATAMFTLGGMDSDLRTLQEQFTVLVAFSNQTGSAQISSTLYKLIDDVIYLRRVAPNIVAALSEKLQSG